MRAEDIGRHDWEIPFVLPCTDGAEASSKGMRMFGKFATVARMFLQGGRQSSWIRHAVLAAGCLNAVFKSDVVWCTFGKMEAVFAARRVAALTGCPWILDIKDNWELYVPRGLRRIMVWRTSGWAVVTTNAEFTGHMARKWQRATPTVIYSGVEDVFYERAVSGSSRANFRINLIGSLYHRNLLRMFLKALREWTNEIGKTTSATIELCYMGTDNAMLDEELEYYPPGISVRRLGYVSIGEMAVNCRNGSINVYIAHSGTFHHKLLELLACGRPLLAIPQEDDESRNLVRQSGGQLIEAADLIAIKTAMVRVYRNCMNKAVGAAPDRRYVWRKQAQQLETVLNAVISADRGEKK